MSVHYKFKSSLDYDTLTFDGLHISVGDLKKSIIQQKKIGKSSDFDLQITNAQTKEVYKEDDTLIPKNSSVIVARIPITGANKKVWDRGDGNQQTLVTKTNDASSEGASFDKLAKTADLTAINASEDDKIKAMMTQSTQDYDPSKYMKIRGMTGPIPPNYLCYRCGKPGHWIKNCPTNTFEVKRSTGIPRSFMVTVEGPEVPGALLTNTGQFAVPVIDHEAYREGKKEKPPFAKEPTPEREEGPNIPEELLCMICRDLLSDAVLIPCCGNSYCDECVRQALLDSDEHECPTCHDKDISPDTLIPNRFLRTAVMNFKNETGYTKVKKIVRPQSPIIPEVEKPIETDTTPITTTTTAATATVITTTTTASTTTITSTITTDTKQETEPSDDRPGTPVRDEKPEGGDDDLLTTSFQPNLEQEESTTTTNVSAATSANQSGYTISTITTRIPRQPYQATIPPLPSFRPSRPPRNNTHAFPEAPRGPPPPLRAPGMQQMPRSFSPKHEGPSSNYHHHHHHHHSRHGYNPPMHPYGSAPPPFHGSLPPPRSGPPHLMNHPLLPLQALHMSHYPSSQIAPPRGMPPPRGPPPPPPPPPPPGYSSQPPPPGSLPLGPSPFEQQPPPPGIPPAPVQHAAGYDYYRDHKNIREKGKNPFAEFERELMEYKVDHNVRTRSRSSSRSYGQSRSSSRSRSPSLSRSMSHSSRSSSRSRSYSYSRSRSMSMSRSRSRTRSRSPYRSRPRSRTRRYSPHYRRSSRSPFGRPRSPLRREYSPGYYNVYRYQPQVSSNFSPDQRGQRFYQQHSYRYDDYHHYNEHRYDAQETQYNPRYDENYHDKRRSWTPDEREKGARHDARKSTRLVEAPRKDEEHAHLTKDNKLVEKKREQKRHKSKSKKEKEHETKAKDSKSRKETSSQSAVRSDRENAPKYERKSNEKEEQVRWHKKSEKHSDSDFEGRKKHKSKVKKAQETTNKIKVKQEKSSTDINTSPAKESGKKQIDKESEQENNVNLNIVKSDPELKMKHVIKEADSTNVLADSTIMEDVDDSKLLNEQQTEFSKIDTPEPDSAGEIGEGTLNEDESENVEEEEEEEDEDDDDDEDNVEMKDDTETEENEESVLIAQIPELSKWERDESDAEDATTSPNREKKQESPKVLSKDIVQRAEKAILQKPLKASLVGVVNENRTQKSIERKTKSSREEKEQQQQQQVLLLPAPLASASTVTSNLLLTEHETDKDKNNKSHKNEKFKLDRSKFQEKISIKDSKGSSRSKKEMESSEKRKSRKDQVDSKKRDQKGSMVGREKRKSTIDESKFEPNYDETSDSDGDKSKKQENKMKRAMSKSPERSSKKIKKEETNDDDDEDNDNDDNNEKKMMENLSGESRRSASVSSSSSASPSSDRSVSPHKRDKSHKHKKTKHKKHRKHKHKHKKKKSHKSVKSSDKH